MAGFGGIGWAQAAPAPAGGAKGFASAGAAASINTAALVQTATPYARQAQKKQAAPWGGGCPWQYDKTAFKKWLRTAVNNRGGQECRELYGYLSECFLDADGDRDGLIGELEFNFLVDKAGAMPRRFGLAPSNQEIYGANLENLPAARAQMFQQMDNQKRGKIGMEEWMSFAMAHITEKVKTIDWETMDFANLEKAGAEEFLSFLALAVQDTKSEQYKALYEFLFKTFVESDVAETGTIRRTEFDVLIEDAAQAPRALGLAPSTQDTYINEAQKTQARDAMFSQMDTDKSGGITFDKFLNWSLSHISVKVSESMGTKFQRVAQNKKSSGRVWGGGCKWQYDKTAFKSWLQRAMEDTKGPERNELYGFLAECFLDADGDRDGLVSLKEFNFLIEKAASMPRRFGLAPSTQEVYGDNDAALAQVRQAMFAQMDTRRRNKIGMEEWIQFAIAHIGEKVKQIDWTTMDFAHLEKTGPSNFVNFLEKAVTDRQSEAYKSLYEHLFKSFVDSDVAEDGAIRIEEFDKLIEDAAQAPRALGLAPSTEQAYPTEQQRKQARAAMFSQMDVDRSGFVTFDKFLNWSMTHIAGKVQEYRRTGGR